MTGISLKAIDSSKKILKITGPALSRINSVIISARTVPSDTKLLLPKNYFEIIFFEKLRISRVISGKSLSFLEIFRVQIPSKITKNNSQGIIFAIISCQRVPEVSEFRSHRAGKAPQHGGPTMHCCQGEFIQKIEDHPHPQ